MKLFYLLAFFLFFSTLMFAQSSMQVIKVSKGKVLHNGRQVKSGDQIKLYRNYPLPPRPRKDFFQKNKITMSPGSLLKVKYKNRIRVLDFNAYRGVGAKKMPRRNSNCLSRGDVEYHRCDDVLADETFFRKSVNSSKVIFQSDSCFKYYFNAGTYWQYEDDTLVFEKQTGYVNMIILEVGKKCLKVKPTKNGEFIIPWKKLPQEGELKIYRNQKTQETLLSGPYFVNLKKLFLSCQEQGLTEKECMIVMRTEYFEPKRDADTKEITEQIERLIEHSYSQHEK